MAEKSGRFFGSIDQQERIRVAKLFSTKIANKNEKKRKKKKRKEFEEKNQREEREERGKIF
jgi:hypothetical protein